MLCLAIATLAASAASVQSTPPIDIIDFYGLRTLLEEQVRQALHIKEGDPMPEDEDKFESEADTARITSTRRAVLV